MRRLSRRTVAVAPWVLGAIVLAPLVASAAGSAVPREEYRALVGECRDALSQRELDPAQAKKLAARLRGVNAVILPGQGSVSVDTKPEADALDALSSTTPDKKLLQRFQALEEQLDRENQAGNTDPRTLATAVLSAREFATSRKKDPGQWKWPQWNVKTPAWLKAVGKWFGNIFTAIGKWFGRQFQAIGRGIGKFFRWLFKSVPAPKFGKFGGFANPANTVLLVLFFLATVAAVVSLYFLTRYLVDQQLRKSGKRTGGMMGGDLDLSEEGITDPLSTARDRATQGDYRSAIRLTYIASLWKLGDAGLLTLEKNRTNWEYQRSLRRRSRQVHDELLPATRLFDRIWYGKQTATQAEFDAVRAIYEKLPSEFASPTMDGTVPGTPTEASTP